MEKGFARFATKDILQDSIVDGEGIRSVIWFQGCSHNCPGCHNPETHDFNAGEVISLDEMKSKINELEFQAGVTFSGGDPMMQVEALTELAAYVHEKGMNVWVYTGFTFEELLTLAEKNDNYRKALEETDVLVDGKFVMELRSFDAQFRGSSNQRILDVKKSLEKGKAVKIEKYK